MIQLRLTPHFFHTLKRLFLALVVKDAYRRILERFWRLGNAMHRPHPIVFHRERFTGVRGRLQQDGVGGVDRDVVIKVVERGEEEAVIR